MMNPPKITIVTVVYNGAQSIVRTLNSVKQQTYKNIEYIVIDGASEDETLSLIDGYSSIVSLLISESDEGIYDAMNKGARLASGDYITFLNAGDVYHSCDAIDRIFSSLNLTEYDVIYGSNYYHKNNAMLLQVPRPLSLFYKGMPFNHQSVFVRTNLVVKYPFKSDIYRIQCEYEFLLNLYLKKYKFYRAEVVVAIYEADGFSDQNFIERTLERWIIIKRYGICDDAADAHYFDLVNTSLHGPKKEEVRNSAPSFINKILSILFKRDSEE